MLLASMLAALPSGLDPARVHLVDVHPRGESPHNFLFRGNNPVTDGHFNLTALVDAMRAAAASECATLLPEAFLLVDLDLENPSDPGFLAELRYWRAHKDQGYALSWPIYGSALDVSKTPFEKRLVTKGTWAIDGHADYLPERLAATRALLLNESAALPIVLYTHCNAGCDRTGEFIGAYAMSYLGYNVTTAMGEACRQCGRCPNFYATQSLSWWCLTLEQRGHAGLGDCRRIATCRYLKDCNASHPTHPASPCPTSHPRRSIGD